MDRFKVLQTTENRFITGLETAEIELNKCSIEMTKTAFTYGFENNRIYILESDRKRF